MKEFTKPLPIPDGDSTVFWEGCKQGKLLLQCCQDCGKFVFYPRLLCPHCMSNHLEWVESSGRGKIYTFTIARRPSSPAFNNDIPYAIAIVELEEGVRMMTNIVNIDVDRIHCDMPVEVLFEQVEEMSLPKFQPLRVSN